MDKFQYTIDESLKGLRIDKALSTLNEEWSRTHVQQWIKDECALVNGTAVKTNYKCNLGDVIEINIPELEELDAVAEPMDLDIYYEDADVLVVNKPRGMVVHPAPGHVIRDTCKRIDGSLYRFIGNKWCYETRYCA